MNAPGGGVLDLMAVLEALQQQLSDLTAVVDAQQRTLHSLLTGPHRRIGGSAGGQLVGVVTGGGQGGA